MHLKVHVLNFENICSKRVVLEEKLKFDHSLVFSSFHLLFHTIYIFICHGPLIFSTIAPLLFLSPQNMWDHVSG